MFTLQVHPKTTKSVSPKIAVVTHPCYMGTTEFLVKIYCLANADSWSTFHGSTLKNLSAHMNTTYFRVYEKFSIAQPLSPKFTETSSSTFKEFYCNALAY